MNEVDCIVIGAGVVGLAVARALARAGRDVIVIERERRPGLHTSSRNSEVVHAGIHYAPESLKAQLCVRGKELLYRYCEQHDVAFRRCGKLTVASSATEENNLRALEANARACGVELVWLEGREAQRLEPELRCTKALLSPSTGIVDSAGLLRSLWGDAESHGARLAFGTVVTALERGKFGIAVRTDADAVSPLLARVVINCAGLSAAVVAASLTEHPRNCVPTMHFAKGNYFTLPGRAPFSHLIYPVPGTSGHLGIHLTLDLGGSARFGPDLEWLETLDPAEPDYSVDERRSGAFIDSIRAYWPTLPAERLVPAYSGIRPKLAGRGEPARDFVICGPEDHGCPGLIHLFGIESPGLTASLALADWVAAMTEA